MILNLKPRVICEVGVGGLDVCKSSHYIGDADIKVILFEPVKEYCDQINAFCQFKGAKNVEIHNFCLYDYDGKVDFYNFREASMIVGIQGPNCNGINTPPGGFKEEGLEVSSVDCFRMSKFDKGDIDVLFIDTEGSEWFTLKHLVSRPTLIMIEMKMGGYINPYIKEIQQWMEINNYVVLKDNGCDLVFVKRNLANLVQDNRYDMKLELKTFGV